MKDEKDRVMLNLYEALSYARVAGVFNDADAALIDGAIIGANLAMQSLGIIPGSSFDSRNMSGDELDEYMRKVALDSTNACCGPVI